MYTLSFYNIQVHSLSFYFVLCSLNVNASYTWSQAPLSSCLVETETSIEKTTTQCSRYWERSKLRVLGEPTGELLLREEVAPGLNQSLWWMMWHFPPKRSIIVFNNFFFFLFGREHGGEGQRDGGRENLKQAPHPTQSLTWGSISWPWDHDMSWNQEVDA